MSTAALTATAPGTWNFKQLMGALGIAVILQSLFLPCLCDVGTAKIVLAYALDALILLRTGVAYMRRETGSGWKFYAWLLCTSPLWIQGMALLIFGEL